MSFRRATLAIKCHSQFTDRGLYVLSPIQVRQLFFGPTLGVTTILVTSPSGPQTAVASVERPIPLEASFVRKVTSPLRLPADNTGGRCAVARQLITGRQLRYIIKRPLRRPKRTVKPILWQSKKRLVVAALIAETKETAVAPRRETGQGNKAIAFS